MKKLLVLGGDHFAIPVVEAAHKQGYYVITCDYLPDNVAHKVSDEYINFSTTDKEGILEAARKLNIDGIVTYTDSGVVTCAYVANKLGLHPTGPYESVEILQNKDKFRAFLATNGFNVPWAFGFASKEEAWESRSKFSYPLIVKPTDSAGSKGCTRVDDECKLLSAIEYAFKYTISGHIIIEEFLEKKGCSSDSDSFSVNGEFKVLTFSAQRFDSQAANEYAPSAFSWPSTFTAEQEEYLKSELQRLICLLKMDSTVYNIETRVGINDKPYIMELSPRGGGNRLSEMVRMSTGADMITAAVRAAVGDSVDIEQKPLNGHWAEIILHADNDGEFVSLQIDPSLPAQIVEEDLWVSPGDHVNKFESARDAIGTLVLRFENAEDLEKAIVNQKEWLKIIVK